MPKIVIFGEVPFSYQSLVINFIILYAKQYIFSCFKCGKLPNLIGFINFLKMNYNVEKYISVKNSTVDKFNSFWEQWKAVLEI